MTADVLVIGGGPAGCATAIGLARRGRSVTLLEQGRHPRFHIGESLLPMSMPLLAELGLLEAVEACGVVKRGADFPSPRPEGFQVFHFRRSLNPTWPHAVQVRRQDFDALLVAKARAEGVTVLELDGVCVNDDDGDADPELVALRDEMRRHPGHRLADREALVRVTERYLRVERDNEQIRAKVAAATNSLARTFDRIVGLLTERGYVTTDRQAGDLQVSADGRLLARIYSESDLLVAECLRTGAWKGLQPAELAAVLSALTTFGVD